jgi:glycosyltransferase involved in cell wall biosynthesis
MRVLQTPVRYPPAVGGVERHVYELSTRLSDRGHDVTVLCARTGGTDAVADVAGVTIRRLVSPLSLGNTDITPTLPAWLLREARWADVVHTHLPTPWSADLSALAGAVTKTPVLVTYHNDIVADGPLKRIARLYENTGMRITLGLADRILITRPGYLDESASLQTYEHKTATVPNGVAVDRFRPVQMTDDQSRTLGFDPDRQQLFFLSVLDEFHGYKGLDVLLAAMEWIVDTQDRPPQLIVGGDGPLRSRYEKLVRSRGLADSVTFIGYVPDEDLPVAYSGADVFVLPSISPSQEGFGLVALEAMACETPVVTTDVVGISSTIASEGLGRVVAPGDERALADAVQSVLADPPDCGPGRDICVEQYSWDQSVDKLLDIYRTVCREEQ